MNRACAIAIYRRAIDPSIGEDEGEAWWSDVQAELEAVVAAPDTAVAAGVIEWWHRDWRDVADTARRAAGRIRRAAARYAGKRAPPLGDVSIRRPSLRDRNDHRRDDP